MQIYPIIVISGFSKPRLFALMYLNPFFDFFAFSFPPSPLPPFYLFLSFFSFCFCSSFFFLPFPVCWACTYMYI
ncbi:hypothetical protein F4809DRAFT_611079 [Biscogniauxia mediterranea]|nr:hypothetical protein F4809DRAFT_611079 [Biscogniauxia mediterranea]